MAISSLLTAAECARGAKAARQFFWRRRSSPACLSYVITGRSAQRGVSVIHACRMAQRRPGMAGT
jgi:hypothetical protein